MSKPKATRWTEDEFLLRSPRCWLIGLLSDSQLQARVSWRRAPYFVRRSIQYGVKYLTGVRENKAVTFSKHLQKLRMQADLTQADLAASCDIPLATLRNYEQGLREPSWRTLFRLARALGVRVEVFESCEDSRRRPTRGSARRGRKPKVATK